MSSPSASSDAGSVTQSFEHILQSFKHILQSFDFQCNKELLNNYHAYCLGKHTQLPFSNSNSHSHFPFQLLFCDVWTSPVVSVTGFQYYLAILNDYTHFVWIFPLRPKSKVVANIIAFSSYVQMQFSSSIHYLQSDNGREFSNASLRLFYSKQGTVFHLSCPYTSQQNRKAESILRTLNDSMRTLLLQASLPYHFWVEALTTATFLLNRQPCRPKALTTPYELLFGSPPDYELLRVFGCLCYPNMTVVAPPPTS